MNRGPILLLSGVDASRTAAELSPDDPKPDFVVLKEAMPLDVLDPGTVASLRSPLVQRARRSLGTSWATALAAFLRLPRYPAVLAAGEDVGLRLAFLMRYLPRRGPLVLICHNVTGRRSSFFLRSLRVGPSIHTFLCLSATQAHMLQHRYGISRTKLRVIGWHVDHRFFTPQPQVPVRRQLCSAGMASRDYATLIRATEGLDADVKIAADSPWFRQTLNISPVDLNERVEVRSYRTYAALRHLYAQSLFVVVPLLDVEFSAGYTVILEAMAMGKAVIASRIRQKDDFVIDGWNGLYVEPGNAYALRCAIERLLGHPDEAARMGRNGRQLVEQRYTLRHFAQAVQEAIPPGRRAGRLC